MGSRLNKYNLLLLAAVSFVQPVRGVSGNLDTYHASADNQDRGRVLHRDELSLVLFPSVLDRRVDNLDVRGVARAHGHDQIVERNHRALVPNLDVRRRYRLNEAAHVFPLCDNLIVGRDGVGEASFLDGARVAHEHGLRRGILKVVFGIDDGDVKPLLLVVVEMKRGPCAGDTAAAYDDVLFRTTPLLFLRHVHNLVHRGVFLLKNFQRRGQRRLDLIERSPESLQHPVVQPRERILVVRERGVLGHRFVRDRRRVSREGKFERGRRGQKPFGDVARRRLHQPQPGHRQRTGGRGRDGLRRLSELIDLHEERHGLFRYPGLLGRDA